MEANFNIRLPYSYGGVQALYRLMKSEATKKHVVDWLANQDAYILHKPIPRRFPCCKTFARDMDYLWRHDAFGRLK